MVEFLLKGFLVVGPELIFFFLIVFFFFYMLTQEKYWYSEGTTDLFIKVAIVHLSIVAFCLFNCSEYCFTWMGYTISPLITSAKLFVCFLSIIILTLSLYHFKEKTFEYPFLFLVAIWGSFIVLSSHDFFYMYLGFEIQNFVFFIFTGLKRNSVISKEGALRYFILGGISSAFMLFGISIIYVTLGTVDFFSVKYIIDVLDYSYDLYCLGFFFFLVGIFFKLALFPFHFWIGDVYEGSPLIVTMFFATVPKFVAFFALANVYITVLSGYPIFFGILAFIGFLSVVYGTIEAYYQYKIVRVFALSSVSHMGLVVFVLSLASPAACVSSVLYMVTYSLITLNFFAILATYAPVKTAKNDGSDKGYSSLIDFIFLPKVSQRAAFIFSLCLLSLGGFPPLLGFFSKFFLYYSLVEYSLQLFFFLLILWNIFSFVFYIRIIRIMYFNTDSFFDDTKHRRPRSIFFFIILLTFFFNFLPIFFFNFLFLNLTHYGLYFFLWF